MEESLVRELRRVYGSLTEVLINKLKNPPRRLYMRVVTTRAEREEVLRLLRSDNVLAHPDPYTPEAIYVEVEGPFEIQCESDKEIIVDDKTASSLLLGANLYRPGVVKTPVFNPGEKLLVVTRTGIPVACVETIVSSRELYRMKRGLVAKNISSPYRAPRITETRAYTAGLIYPQSLPSMATIHALSPKPGELIVDMNASPGGKSSHIIQYTRGKSRLVSIDRNEKKVALLKETLIKLGLDLNNVAIPGDSRYIHIDLNLENRADRILIDPPCSNLGVRPVLKQDKTIRDVENLVEYQKQFLKAAYHVVKKNGIVVYSTCTLTLRENEENIRYAVEELGFTSVELEKPLPYSEVVKYKGIVGYRYSPLSHDMPGYFIAVLTK